MNVAVWMGEVSCFCEKSNRPETSKTITSSSQQTELSSENVIISDVTSMLEVFDIEGNLPTVKEEIIGLLEGDTVVGYLEIIKQNYPGSLECIFDLCK